MCRPCWVTDGPATDRSTPWSSSVAPPLTAVVTRGRRDPGRRPPPARRRPTARTEPRPSASMSSGDGSSLSTRRNATAEEDDVEKTTSADGTTIAYDVWGDGPAVVIVGGA